MPLNAYKADYATLANAAMYSVSTNTSVTAVHEIETFYGHSLGIDGNTIKLKDASGNYISNSGISISSLYWGDQQVSSSSSKITTPTVKTISFIENNSTQAKNATLSYNATTETLNFVFA